MNAAEQLHQYVVSVYEPEDVVEIRILRGGDARKHWCAAKELPSLADQLGKANGDGWNIYIGVNPRKGKGLSGDVNVAVFRCVFVDFDHIEADGCSPTEIALSRIEDAGLPVPTLVIYSGHGTHGYWRLAVPVAEGTWRNLQARLNQALGSDPAIRNPERIMRLPSFHNVKAAAHPVECFIVQADPSAVYPVEAIAGVLPALTEKAPTLAPAQKPGTSNAKVAKAHAVLYSHKWESCAEGERGNQAYRHAAQLRELGLSEADTLEILSDWDATNLPPLGQAGLRSVIVNVQKYAKGTPGAKLAEGRSPRQRAPLPPTTTDAEPAAELESLIEAEIDGRCANLPWPWPLLTGLVQALMPQTRTLFVGGTGASKSLAILQSLTVWMSLGIKVAVLELERSREFHLKRVLAQRAGIAGLTTSQWVQENPDLVRRLFTEHREYINAMGQAIHTVPQQFTIEQASEWVEEQARAGARIICIDPVTALSRGRECWADDEKFLARVEKAVRQSGASLICVSHPRKGGNDQPHLDNIAGGAAWARFPDAVVWLESHDARISLIKTPCGTDEQMHNRTLHLLKSRSGEGDHLRLAYRFETGMNQGDSGALTLKELGIIVRKRKN
jgi:hypothetical protein